MGIISPLGRGREETLISIKSSKKTLKKITSIPKVNKLFSQIGGEVLFTKEEKNSFEDKVEQLAYFALKEALKDRGVTLQGKNCAIIFATCNGKNLSLEKIYREFDSQTDLLDKQKDKCTLSDKLKRSLGIHGSEFNIVTACTASAHAIILAANLIETKTYDLAIVCGVDSFCQSTLGGFNALQALSKNGSAPFSTEVGLTLGEGAGCLIIEQLNKTNKNKIYAQISGSSFSEDAYHMTTPDPTGESLKRTMNEAIKDAGIPKEDINVICAHGTGTLTNDAAESLAIKHCFQKFLTISKKNLKITSTKSMTGHTLGASGIIQAIIMIDCMHENLIPAILNFKNNRTGCDLNYIKNKPLCFSFEHFISNSLAFGGNNTSIVFSKYPQPHIRTSPLAKDLDKIVITGFEGLTPLAGTKEQLSKIMEKQNKIQTPKIIKFKNSMMSEIKHEKNFMKHRRAPQNAQFAIKASKNILLDVNYSPFKTGILWNHWMGNLKAFEETYLETLKYGFEYTPAINFTNTVFNATSGYISNNLNIKGPQTTFWGQYCPFTSILFAKLLLKKDKTDIFLVGSSEKISKYEEKMMQEKTNGNKAITEGAAIILLETEKKAKQRNAKIYAEILDINISDNSFENGLNICLDRSNLKLADIDLNIDTVFGTNKVAKYSFKESINSEDYLGSMGSSSILLNIGLALNYFKKNKDIKHITITAQTLNKLNYCLILKNNT
ncbi:MAG: hypothetical protein GY830_02235 [Bacteroidetes bacterium]|nr:hypothetical protein [Bacteroidota bacterium]